MFPLTRDRSRNRSAFGYRPTLNLIFGPNSGDTLDPRITFSRTSNATQFDSAGNLVYAPHNLLTFSEQFDNAAFTKVNSTVTANTEVAPNGTTTADLMAGSAGTSTKYVFSQFSTTSTGVYTASVYAKAGTESFVVVRITDNTGANAARQRFNLATGAKDGSVGIEGTVTSGSSDITAVGNGWYRCSITTTFNSALTLIQANFWLNSYASVSLTTNLLFWGAQLNIGTLQPYYPTTVKNLLGYSQEFDNAAWTKTNSFIQTNLLLQSETFDNATWGKSNVTITANTTASPNGAITGDTLLTTAAGGAMNQTSQSFVAGSAVTVSVYAKKNTSNFLRIELGNLVSCWFNLNTGVTGSNGAGSGNVLFSAKSIQDAGNGWYRCVLTVTTTTITTLSVLLFPADTDGASSSINSSVFLWGAQTVQGSVPGDYQETVATALPVQYVAPDGSVTADKLVEDTAAAFHQVSQTYSATASSVLTLSAYAKAGERPRVRLAGLSSANWVSLPAAVFDLSTGTVVTSTGAATATITSVGGGWYRCAIYGQTVSTGTTSVGLAAGPVQAGGTTNNYTGDGTSGIYIWGAQLSDSASLDPYVYNPVAAPSAAAYYGPRFDYDPVTLAARGLLIEEQRTNLLVQSTLASGWTLTTVTRTVNATTAPDGTLTANFYTSTGADSSVAQLPVTVSASTTYTFSIWLRADIATTVSIFIVDTGGGSGNTSAVCNVTTQWTRFVVTRTTSAGTTSCTVQVGGANTFSTGEAVYVWGAQLEAGAFATSYIPTTTAAATRTADVATMVGANFSNWYRQDEGTLFGDVAVLSSAYANGVFLDVGAGGAFGTTAYMNWSGSQWGINPNTAPVNMLSLVTTTSTAKTAAALAANNTIASANGLLGVLDTSCAMPLSATTLSIGRGGWSGATNYFNGHIRRIAYYPTRLSNAQLQAVTA